MNAEAERTERRRDTTLEVLEGEGNELKPAYLYLEEIVIDGGTQPRAAIDLKHVKLLEEQMEDGQELEPVTVFYDGESYWLADGFHRCSAHRNRGLEAIACVVCSGTRRDAVLYSVGANADHKPALPRTQQDKRRAVMTLLQDPEWGKWSDREIARYCKVDHKTVGKIRTCLTGEFPSDKQRTYQTKHGTIAQMQVDSIGGKNNSTNDLTFTANFISPVGESQEQRLRQDNSTVDLNRQSNIISPETGAIATVAPTHPLSGSTVAIAEIPNKDGAVVELQNGSREYILLKDLQLHSSSEVHQFEFFVSEEISYGSFPDSESTYSTIKNRNTKLVRQTLADANFSLCQIVCEITVGLIACIEYVPLDLLRSFAGSIEREISSRLSSNQLIKNSETFGD